MLVDLWHLWRSSQKNISILFLSWLRLYLWALSIIVGTNLSVGLPFLSFESGRYQDRASWRSSWSRVHLFHVNFYGRRILRAVTSQLRLKARASVIWGVVSLSWIILGYRRFQSSKTRWFQCKYWPSSCRFVYQL